MNATLLYIARASLYLALFYAFYLLVMRRTSFFRFNRAVLLLGTVICHLLPLLRLRTVILTQAVGIEVGELEMVTDEIGDTAAPFPWLAVLYGTGVAAVLLLCIISALRTRRVIRSGSPQACEGCRLTLLEQDVPSFSWGRQVVMSRNDYEKYPAILRHELEHVRAHHSLDVLLMTAVAAVHWFNPLVWIARAELRLMHEYEADDNLINQGIDATSYQLLLVRKAVGEQRFSLANGFNHAKLKQRITMMQHTPTPAWMRLAYVALLPFLAGTMFLCNPARAEIRPVSSDAPVVEAAAPTTIIANVQVRDDNDKIVPYSDVEIRPTFQGQEAGAFALWVAQNLQYPKQAAEDGIQGRVMVQFTIGSDGEVSDVKILRGVHELLDAEAVRVISASPKWEPGKVKGEPVRVTFQFPVVFKLNGNDDPVQVMSVRKGDASPSIMIRSASGSTPLVYLDGVKYTGKVEDIDPSTISSMEVLRDEAAVNKYGEEAKNGVILITTKK